MAKPSFFARKQRKISSLVSIFRFIFPSSAVFKKYKGLVAKSMKILENDYALNQVHIVGPSIPAGAIMMIAPKYFGSILDDLNQHEKVENRGTLLTF